MPSEPPSIFECPLLQNSWAHAPLRCTLTSAHLSAHHTAIGSGLPASWGLTLTLGCPLRGPSQGAWHHIAEDWGPLSLSDRLTLLPGHHPGPLGLSLSFRVGEWAWPSEPWATFELCTRQNPWAHAPLPCALTSARPSAHHTAISSGLPASWGLIFTLSRP